MKFLLTFFILFGCLTASAKEWIVFNSPNQSFAMFHMEHRMKHFDASVYDLTDAQVAKLKASGVRVEENVKVHVLGYPTPGLKTMATPPKVGWGIVAVKSREANLQDNALGDGITVCVVDTGVDESHPDLKGQVSGGELHVSSMSPPVGKPEYFDDQGHGTHVSGTIAALDKDDGIVGVAPHAKIYAVKVLDSQGSGTEADVADGMKACVGKAQVISMSLGADQDMPVVHDAVDYVLSKGLILVAAAGNNYGKVGYPAAYKGVVAVSAIDSKMDIALFSSTGPEISFAAPGMGIVSTIPGGNYASWAGTSMACPHVSGVMAVMLSAKKSTALGTQLPKLTSDQQGKGLIDAQKTVESP